MIQTGANLNCYYIYNFSNFSTLSHVEGPIEKHFLQTFPNLNPIQLCSLILDWFMAWIVGGFCNTLSFWHLKPQDSKSVIIILQNMLCQTCQCLTLIVSLIFSISYFSPMIQMYCKVLQFATRRHLFYLLNVCDILHQNAFWVLL